MKQKFTTLKIQLLEAKESGTKYIKISSFFSLSFEIRKTENRDEMTILQWNVNGFYEHLGEL